MTNLDVVINSAFASFSGSAIRYVCIGFSLLLGRLSNREGGAEKVAGKRARIYRFLAGCQAEEVRVFINLVFTPIAKWLSEQSSISDMVAAIDKNYSLTESVPLSKLQG